MPEADEQAEGFGRTRSDHRSEIAEDYVELIADLIDATGEARAVDLAAGWASPTPRSPTRSPGCSVMAWSTPSPIARSSSPATAATWPSMPAPAQIVYGFLRALGVSEEVARVDAEGIEHHVSDETLDAFDRLLQERDRGGESG